MDELGGHKGLRAFLRGMALCMSAPIIFGDTNWEKDRPEYFQRSTALLLLSPLSLLANVKCHRVWLPGCGKIVFGNLLICTGNKKRPGRSDFIRALHLLVAARKTFANPGVRQMAWVRVGKIATLLYFMEHWVSTLPLKIRRRWEKTFRCYLF